MSTEDDVTSFAATLPDWITALGIVCSAIVAIIVRVLSLPFVIILSACGVLRLINTALNHVCVAASSAGLFDGARQIPRRGGGR
jgi:hypothetical protein